MTTPQVIAAAAITLVSPLVGLGPFASSSSHAARATVPVTVAPTGVSVAVDRLQLGHATSAVAAAPADAAALSASRTGSLAAARHVRLTIVRVSDSATLFVGSLASFHALPVAAGDRLRVTLVRDGGYRGLHAGARLEWGAA